MQDEKTLRASAYIIITYFLVLLIGALIFYKERMLFSDATFTLFNIINSDTLQVAEYRYGSFITQMFPLIGLKLGLSLNTLMLLYSASFNLFYLENIHNRMKAEPNEFIDCFRKLKMADLNAAYFSIDSLHPYQLLDTCTKAIKPNFAAF